MKRIYVVVLSFALITASCKDDPYNKPISELSLKDIQQIQQENYDKAEKEQLEKHKKEQAIIDSPPPPALPTFDLPLISAKTSDIKSHIVKLNISLGYEESAELSAELTRKTQQLQHIIKVIINGKKYEDFNSTENEINLQDEIKEIINRILVTGKIKEVYFRDYSYNLR